MASKTFGSGAVIFKQGDLSGTVYLVQSGQVRITQRTRDGDTVELGLVGPNGLFGEMALIDNTLRMASATAVGETTCTVIDAAALTRLLEQLTGEALRVYNDMLAYIRGNLPFEARSPEQQARGDTDKDREARKLLHQLPAVIRRLEDKPVILRAIFSVLGQYVQRRLPPA